MDFFCKFLLRLSISCWSLHCSHIDICKYINIYLSISARVYSARGAETTPNVHTNVWTCFLTSTLLSISNRLPKPTPLGINAFPFEALPSAIVLAPCSLGTSDFSIGISSFCHPSFGLSYFSSFGRRSCFTFLWALMDFFFRSALLMTVPAPPSAFLRVSSLDLLFGSPFLCPHFGYLCICSLDLLVWLVWLWITSLDLLFVVTVPASPPLGTSGYPP